MKENQPPFISDLYSQLRPWELNWCLTTKIPVINWDEGGFWLFRLVCYLHSNEKKIEFRGHFQGISNIHFSLLDIFMMRKQKNKAKIKIYPQDGGGGIMAPPPPPSPPPR